MSTARNALGDWKRRCGMTSFAHHRVQARYDKRHTYLGIIITRLHDRDGYQFICRPW